MTAKMENPRTIQVMVRMTPEGAKALDKLRGETGRAEYLRELVKKEWEQRK